MAKRIKLCRRMFVRHTHLRLTGILAGRTSPNGKRLPIPPAGRLWVIRGFFETPGVFQMLNIGLWQRRYIQPLKRGEL